MSKIRKTVSVEILRHGPTHNHLLSPLTQYLGLCGNFAAATVEVPYEQYQFDSKIEGLRYQDGTRKNSERLLHLEDFGQKIAEIFGSIQGLTSELGDTSQANAGFINISLTLSAAELAMLPFESSKVPIGCAGGEGDWLLIQNKLPIALTRRVRNVSNPRFIWPRRPKILFISASPAGLTVPARHHLTSILKALKPWMKNTSSDAERRKEVEKHLVIIENATTEAINTACDKDSFTHVHILAHGMINSEIPGSPFGLALHAKNSRDEIEVVDGQRLASMLSCSRVREVTEDENILPSIVTIAACDSGNTNSVISATGGSLAHDIHRAGIPFVVASQFPLSKRGSVRLVSEFYEYVLWGGDPRVAVALIRKSLHGLSSDTHDWASILAYGALPVDIRDQLVFTQYEQSKAAINVALHNIDKAIKDDVSDEKIDALIEPVDVAAKRMPTDQGFAVEGLGFKASTEKRKAESYFQLARKTGDPDDHRRSVEWLDDAREDYRQAFLLTMAESKEKVITKSTHWVLGQYLSLKAVLGEPIDNDHWYTARLSCQTDLMAKDIQTEGWAHGTLAELYLLILAYEDGNYADSHQQAQAKTKEHIAAIRNLVRADDFIIESTRRQFNRYIRWWGNEDFLKSLKIAGKTRPLVWDKDSAIIKTAQSIVDQLT